MSTTFDTDSIPELRAGLKGQMIAPDDEAYETARTVFYGSIDRRPAVIAQPAYAGEVSRVVALARDSGAELAVRSGGHSLAGHGVSDGPWTGPGWTHENRRRREQPAA